MNSNNLKTIQEKNQKYQEELKKAKHELSGYRREKSTTRFLGVTKTNADLNRTMDDNMSMYSMHSSMSANKIISQRRNQPRKTQILFNDVRKKLSEICNESEEMTRNMDIMMKNLDKGIPRRRSSLGVNTSINSGMGMFNDSFMRTMKVPRIEEIEEEEEEDCNKSVFSIKVKDEITHCREKIEDYTEIIREMTAQVSQIEEENEVLAAEVEHMEIIIIDEKQKSEKLMSERDHWTRKFLKVLNEFENSKLIIIELEENLQDAHSDKYQTVKTGEGQTGEILKDNLMLFQDNEKLRQELGNVKMEKNLIESEKVNIEQNFFEFENNNKDLVSKLQKEVLLKESLVKQFEKFAEKKQKTDAEMLIENEELIQMLEQKLETFQIENREMRSEVEKSKNLNLELESELQFMKDGEGYSQNLGMHSHLENSRMLLDITQDMGRFHQEPNDAGDHSFMKGPMNDNSYLTDLQPDTSFNKSIFGRSMYKSKKKQILEPIGNDNLDQLLGKPVPQEVYEELGEKTQKIEQLLKEKENILREKHEEINSLQEKIIQVQKDYDFKLKSKDNRKSHEFKVFKKEKKKLKKDIRGLESRLVQLKILTSKTIVDKDELEMRLVKNCRLLQAKIDEYEKNIREFNLLNRTRDKRGFFSKMFNL